MTLNLEEISIEITYDKQLDFDHIFANEAPAALYSAESLIDIEGHENVVITWFVHDRPYPWPPVHYQALVLDYNQYEGEKSKLYAEGYIDELFRLEEVKLFETWSEEYIDIKIRKQAKPIPLKFEGKMPIGATPIGGPGNFIMLPKMEIYDLPFEVWGYFNLRETTTPGEFNQKVNYQNFREN